MSKPESPELNPLQKKVLEFIADSIQGKGYPPTLSEIAKACGIGQKSSAAFHVGVLESKGYLKREGTARGLALTEHPFRLPILGRVGAGGGIIAQEDVEGHIVFDRDSLRGAQFVLRVKGDSMVGAAILEGDLVQVRRQSFAEDGEIVVALVDEEGVVKRLRKRGGSWSLESANPKYSPIEGEFQVLGKVVGLIRQYENH